MFVFGSFLVQYKSKLVELGMISMAMRRNLQ
jgi:hypothetical protein